MPLTKKGAKIMRSMRETYGDDEEAKRVFYASANAGKITGVHKAKDAAPLILFDTDALIDRGTVKHRDGYLTCEARVARTGVQRYRGHEVGLSDREHVVLYRPPEEVFAYRAMHSMASKPVTYLHPKQMVDSSIWTKVAKGFSGNEVVRDGEYVRVPLMLTDAATIDAFEKGEARELSVGYTTDIDWTPGETPDGERYDGVQRAIHANHHALVPVARGGESLRFGDAQYESQGASVTTCKNCGARLTGSPLSCPNCGADLRPTPRAGEAIDTDDGDDVYDRDVSAAERKSLAKKGQALKGGGFPIKNKCLHGDTLIATLEGVPRAIKDMVGHKPWLYGYDSITRAVVPVQASRVWLSRKNAPLLKIGLDNGETVLCTANHPFMLRDGSYAKAEDLRVGASLMPLYRKWKKLNGKDQTAYEHLWQPFYSYWEQTHRMVYRGHYGELPGAELSIHHVRGRGSELDNRPDNLEALSESEHRKAHWKLNRSVGLKAATAGRKARWAKPDARLRQSAVMKAENDARKADGRIIDISARISAKKRGMWRKALPDDVAQQYLAGRSLDEIAVAYGVGRSTVTTQLKRLGVELRPQGRDGERNAKGQWLKTADAPTNHKVVSIADGGVADVYDIEVPRTSNFALQCGIFVHNSDLENAIQAFGRAKNPAATKALIKRRAKDLGAESSLPEDWQTDAVGDGTSQEIEAMPIIRTFDGIPISFADEISAAAMDREMRKLRDQVANFKGKKAKPFGKGGNGNGDDTDDDDVADAGNGNGNGDDDDADAIEAKRRKVTAEDGLRRAVAAKDGEIAVLKKQLADAATVEAKVEAMAAERIALLDAAKPFLPQGFKDGGKTLADIRRAAVATVMTDAEIKDWTDDQFIGAFKTLAKSGAQKSGGGAQALADGLSRGLRDGGVGSGGYTVNGMSLADSQAKAEQAYNQMIKELQDGYKTPISAVRN